MHNYCPNDALNLVEIDKEIDGEIVKRNRVVQSDNCQQCGDCVKYVLQHAETHRRQSTTQRILYTL